MRIREADNFLSATIKGAVESFGAVMSLVCLLQLSQLAVWPPLE